MSGMLCPIIFECVFLGAGLFCVELMSVGFLCDVCHQSRCSSCLSVSRDGCQSYGPFC